jgi:hypothetical protein
MISRAYRNADDGFKIALYGLGSQLPVDLPRIPARCDLDDLAYYCGSLLEEFFM